MIKRLQSLRPAGGFKVILADPPWRFAAWSENGEEKGAASQYDCMSVDDMAAIMNPTPRKTCCICGRTAEAGTGVVVTGGGHWVCLDGPCQKELIRREVQK